MRRPGAKRRARRDADQADQAERKRLPYDYVGPTTRFGLVRGSRCRVLGRARGGMLHVMTADGARWQVLRSQLERRA